jgi:FAD/FMN-containing dehydrogenase
MNTTVKTRLGSTTTVSDDALAQLRQQLGRVATVSVGGAASREAFNAMHQGVPALTVSCSSTADVVAAVNFAREHDLLVCVRGGGHSIAGFSAVEQSLLIDLGPMSGVHVDPDTRLARVQGGARWADFDREAQAFGLATPGGVNSETGVAGLTLGGGYGWLRRAFGLSCDNLVAAQIECADGIVRTASADSHPDLYWAIRGGGGNFGIATSFTFKLHPVGPLVAFAATFYPLSEITKILRGWRTYLTDAPDEVSALAAAFTFPPDPHMPPAIQGVPVVVIGGVYAGDFATGMRSMQPLRELGTPLFDMSGPMPYAGVQSGFDALFPRNKLHAYWKSQYLDTLSDAAIDTIARAAADRPSPLAMLAALNMGGAIARVAPEDTAIAERNAAYLVTVDGNWENPADTLRMIAWVRATWDEVRKFGNGATYLNFGGRSDEAPSAGVESAFGRNLERLARVKAVYDPTNLFRLNNNIAPAPAPT